MLYFFLLKYLSYPLWIFNPCTSMGIGHQVRTSSLHQKKPGAESHQEEKFLKQTRSAEAFWPKASTMEPHWTSKPEPWLLLLPENWSDPLLDFQPMYINGRWTSSQNQLFASTRTWCWITLRRNIPSGWGHQPRNRAGHPSKSCWHALLLPLPENLSGYPPLDFQPVCIYGRWASSQK